LSALNPGSAAGRIRALEEDCFDDPADVQHDQVRTTHRPDYPRPPGFETRTRSKATLGWRSGFRGPYPAPDAAPFLPAGTSVRDFPATGLGVDVQWTRGHWNTSGEWQRFQYDLQGFPEAPSVTSTYFEAKRILTPRFYLAGRMS
jgi:hypothetical protein